MSGLWTRGRVHMNGTAGLRVDDTAKWASRSARAASRIGREWKTVEGSTFLLNCNLWFFWISCGTGKLWLMTFLCQVIFPSSTLINRQKYSHNLTMYKILSSLGILTNDADGFFAVGFDVTKRNKKGTWKSWRRMPKHFAVYTLYSFLLLYIQSRSLQ